MMFTTVKTSGSVIRVPGVLVFCKQGVLEEITIEGFQRFQDNYGRKPSGALVEVI